MRQPSAASPSLLPFLVVGVLVLLSLNLVHMLWEWWGSSTVRIPPREATDATLPRGTPRKVEAPVFSHNLQFGDSNAAATLTIFTDPACAPCRAQVARALEPVGRTNIRVVYKFWPINPNNTDGGLITEIARREGATVPFMRALEAQATAQGSDLLAVLETAGVPLAKQQNWLKNKTGDLVDTITQDITQGKALNLGSAPQFILNDFLLEPTTLPVSNLPLYVQRLNAGEPLTQPDDYWLNPAK